MGQSEESGTGTVEAMPDPNHAVTGGDIVAKPQRTTSPAFQFYPKDFLSSSKVMKMTATERGIYITLLCVCWLEGGLPDDVKELADLSRVPLKQFARIWPHNLQKCFTVVRNGRLINDRLDRERHKQAEFRQRQSDFGRKSADMRKGSLNQPSTTLVEGKGNSPISDLQSPISNLRSKNKKSVSAEPLRDSTPAVLVFMTVGRGPKEWTLTEGQVASWREAYPALDIAAECRRARVWVEAQPVRRKTAAGMPRFLVSWFNRATSSGPRAVLQATGTDGRGRTGRPFDGKYDALEEA